MNFVEKYQKLFNIAGAMLLLICFVTAFYISSWVVPIANDVDTVYWLLTSTQNLITALLLWAMGLVLGVKLLFLNFNHNNRSN